MPEDIRYQTTLFGYKIEYDFRGTWSEAFVDGEQVKRFESDKGEAFGKMIDWAKQNKAGDRAKKPTSKPTTVKPTKGEGASDGN